MLGRVCAVLALGAVAHCSVVLIQDAGVDDYMCTVLLSHFSDFEGEVIVNADSSLPSSVEAADQLHRIIAKVRRSNDDIALSLSRARMFNAFPYEYRSDSLKFLNLTEQLEPGTSLQWPFLDGDAWLEAYLAKNTNVSLVITTAPTPLTNILARRPELARSIRAVYWMAGAVYVDGNLDPNEFRWNNTKAEWNVFTDPEAGEALLQQCHEAGVPLYLFPLDISDNTPISDEFFAVLQKAINASAPGSPQRQLHQLVYDAYQLDAGPEHPYYRLWDTVAAGYLLWPELYQQPTKLSLQIVTAPPTMGWTRPCQGAHSPVVGCYDAYVVLDFLSVDARNTFIDNVAGA
eukprot:TRINITY_DN11308_c0_g1_i1.p1 TRINITY_DN11308_c0_g1~~TRINITY_DN11308_c0_g1_i1.p1  ORF type:complete len:346 (+),score=129.39 TRINITY_DN11308_c0_g1_i1:667-1704(+)